MKDKIKVVTIVPKTVEQCSRFVEWAKNRFDCQLSIIVVSPLNVSGREVTERAIAELQDSYSDDPQISDWRYQSVLYARNFVILSRYCDLIINGLGWNDFHKYFNHDEAATLGSLPVLTMEEPYDLNKHVLLFYKIGESTLEDIKTYFDLFPDADDHKGITLVIIPEDRAKRNFDDQKKLIDYLRKRCRKLAVRTIIQGLDEVESLMNEECGVVYDKSLEDVVVNWNYNLDALHRARFAFTSLR